MTDKTKDILGDIIAVALVVFVSAMVATFVSLLIGCHQHPTERREGYYVSWDSVLNDRRPEIEAAMGEFPCGSFGTHPAKNTVRIIVGTRACDELDYEKSLGSSWRCDLGQYQILLHPAALALDVTSLYLVVAHEMGHVVMGPAHTEEPRFESSPVSLMVPDPTKFVEGRPTAGKMLPHFLDAQREYLEETLCL